MKHKPIFVSVANNHSLDFGIRGYKETQKFLRDNHFLFPRYKNATHKDSICFINATDHCGCSNIDEWSNHIWVIDYNDINSVLEKLRKLRKKNKLIIFSIHWGSNYVRKIPTELKTFGRLLIDNGVSIVFGHSAHHIPPRPIEIYKNGIIIYGLGDFINDYSINQKYESQKSLMCEIESKNNNLYSYNLIPIERYFKYDLSNGTKTSSSIPYPIK